MEVDLIEVRAHAVLFEGKHLRGAGVLAAVFGGRAEVVGQARRRFVGTDIFFQVDVGGDPLDQKRGG